MVQVSIAFGQYLLPASLTHTLFALNHGLIVLPQVLLVNHIDPFDHHTHRNSKD